MSDESVTNWLGALQGGNSEAEQRLWDRYFEQMVRIAQAKLSPAARGAVDGEDVALSAFHSLFKGIDQGKFPQLRDRNDLWRILVTITVRKSWKQTRNQSRMKRGGGRVRAEADLSPDDEMRMLDQLIGSAPTPESVALVEEEFQRLIAMLKDPMLEQLALLKLAGHSNEEISQELKCVERTIERKLGRIRRIWSDEGPGEL